MDEEDQQGASELTSEGGDERRQNILNKLTKINRTGINKSSQSGGANRNNRPIVNILTSRFGPKPLPPVDEKKGTVQDPIPLDDDEDESIKVGEEEDHEQPMTIDSSEETEGSPQTTLTRLRKNKMVLSEDEEEDRPHEEGPSNPQTDRGPPEVDSHISNSSPQMNYSTLKFSVLSDAHPNLFKGTDFEPLLVQYEEDMTPVDKDDEDLTIETEKRGGAIDPSEIRDPKISRLLSFDLSLVERQFRSRETSVLITFYKEWLRFNSRPSGSNRYARDSSLVKVDTSSDALSREQQLKRHSMNRMTWLSLQRKTVESMMDMGYLEAGKAARTIDLVRFFNRRVDVWLDVVELAIATDMFFSRHNFYANEANVYYLVGVRGKRAGLDDDSSSEDESESSDEEEEEGLVSDNFLERSFQEVFDIERLLPTLQRWVFWAEEKVVNVLRDLSRDDRLSNEESNGVDFNNSYLKNWLLERGLCVPIDSHDEDNDYEVFPFQAMNILISDKDGEATDQYVEPMEVYSRVENDWLWSYVIRMVDLTCMIPVMGDSSDRRRVWDDKCQSFLFASISLMSSTMSHHSDYFRARERLTSSSKKSAGVTPSSRKEAKKNHRLFKAGYKGIRNIIANRPKRFSVDFHNPLLPRLLISPKDESIGICSRDNIEGVENIVLNCVYGIYYDPSNRSYKRIESTTKTGLQKRYPVYENGEEEGGEPLLGDNTFSWVQDRQYVCFWMPSISTKRVLLSSIILASKMIDQSRHNEGGSKCLNPFVTKIWGDGADDCIRKTYVHGFGVSETSLEYVQLYTHSQTIDGYRGFKTYIRRRLLVFMAQRFTKIEVRSSSSFDSHLTETKKGSRLLASRKLPLEVLVNSLTGYMLNGGCIVVPDKLFDSLMKGNSSGLYYNNFEHVNHLKKLYLNSSPMELDDGLVEQISLSEDVLDHLVADFSRPKSHSKTGSAYPMERKKLLLMDATCGILGVYNNTGAIRPSLFEAFSEKEERHLRDIDLRDQFRFLSLWTNETTSLLRELLDRTHAEVSSKLPHNEGRRERGFAAFHAYLSVLERSLSATEFKGFEEALRSAASHHNANPLWSKKILMLEDYHIVRNVLEKKKTANEAEGEFRTRQYVYSDEEWTRMTKTGEPSPERSEVIFTGDQETALIHRVTDCLNSHALKALKYPKEFVPSVSSISNTWRKDISRYASLSFLTNEDDNYVSHGQIINVVVTSILFLRYGSAPESLKASGLDYESLSSSLCLIQIVRLFKTVHNITRLTDTEVLMLSMRKSIDGVADKVSKAFSYHNPSFWRDAYDNEPMSRVVFWFSCMFRLPNDKSETEENKVQRMMLNPFLVSPFDLRLMCILLFSWDYGRPQFKLHFHLESVQKIRLDHLRELFRLSMKYEDEFSKIRSRQMLEDADPFTSANTTSIKNIKTCGRVSALIDGIIQEMKVDNSLFLHEQVPESVAIISWFRHVFNAFDDTKNIGSLVDGFKAHLEKVVQNNFDIVLTTRVLMEPLEDLSQQDKKEKAMKKKKAEMEEKKRRMMEIKNDVVLTITKKIEKLGKGKELMKLLRPKDQGDLRVTLRKIMDKSHLNFSVVRTHDTGDPSWVIIRTIVDMLGSQTPNNSISWDKKHGNIPKALVFVLSHGVSVKDVRSRLEEFSDGLLEGGKEGDEAIDISLHVLKLFDGLLDLMDDDDAGRYDFAVNTVKLILSILASSYNSRFIVLDFHKEEGRKNKNVIEFIGPRKLFDIKTHHSQDAVRLTIGGLSNPGNHSSFLSLETDFIGGGETEFIIHQGLEFKTLGMVIGETNDPKTPSFVLGKRDRGNENTWQKSIRLIMDKKKTPLAPQAQQAEEEDEEE